MKHLSVLHTPSYIHMACCRLLTPTVLHHLPVILTCIFFFSGWDVCHISVKSSQKSNNPLQGHLETVMLLQLMVPRSKQSFILFVYVLFKSSRISSFLRKFKRETANIPPKMLKCFKTTKNESEVILTVHRR
jgi:hypothetical protein